VHGTLLAVVHPDDTPHGYNLTFAFPMLMFIIVAGALYLLFRSAHRVPGHVALESSRWAGGLGGSAAGGGAAASGAAASGAAASGAAAAGAAEAGQAGSGNPADESTEDSE
jgi:hypothetical protein